MPNVLPNLNGVALIHSDEQSISRSSCILDTTAGLYDSNGTVNTSYTATFPSMFQVNTVPVGTVVVVQAKVHPSAEWNTIWTSSAQTPAYLATFQMPYNFMRAVRTSGTGDVKAFQAMYIPDNMS